MPLSGQATALILGIFFAASGGAGAFVTSAVPAHRAGASLIRMNGGSATARPGGGKGAVGGARQQGRLKSFNQVKGFGFVSPSGGGDEVFLHHSEVQGSTTLLVEGVELTFELRQDGTGRTSATAAELVGAPGAAAGMTRIPCFSMSQPFASLLLYGQKTIETRNNEMFNGVEGRVAVHVGRRPWKDTAYLDRLNEAGLSAERVKHLCSLPQGFAAGDIIGTVVVGPTHLGSHEERGSAAVEAGVVARRDDMGKYLTPVSDPAWLPRGVTVPGRPGVWEVDVPTYLLALPE